MFNVNLFFSTSRASSSDTTREQNYKNIRPAGTGNTCIHTCPTTYPPFHIALSNERDYRYVAKHETTTGRDKALATIYMPLFRKYLRPETRGTSDTTVHTISATHHIQVLPPIPSCFALWVMAYSAVELLLYQLLA
jgi:hypothetical protein